MRSACATALVLAPLVLCILGLALYPQLILQRTDADRRSRRSPRDRRRSADAKRPQAADGSARPLSE